MNKQLIYTYDLKKFLSLQEIYFAVLNYNSFVIIAGIKNAFSIYDIHLHDDYEIKLNGLKSVSLLLKNDAINRNEPSDITATITFYNSKLINYTKMRYPEFGKFLNEYLVDSDVLL